MWKHPSASSIMWLHFTHWRHSLCRASDCNFASSGFGFGFLLLYSPHDIPSCQFTLQFKQNNPSHFTHFLNPELSYEIPFEVDALEKLEGLIVSVNDISIEHLGFGQYTFWEGGIDSSFILWDIISKSFGVKNFFAPSRVSFTLQPSWGQNGNIPWSNLTSTCCFMQEKQ